MPETRLQSRRSRELFAPGQQHPPDMIELFCWVFGDIYPFSVYISRKTTINGLKEAIMAKGPIHLEGTMAYSLHLWKKIISSEERKNFKLSDLNLHDALDNTHRIGKYFIGDPPEECIHIVVRVPGK